MVIRRLKIKNFGKIRDKDMELSPGINVLYGENESGKTTTHTFIRSMFYGVRRLRGKAALNDTYTKYEPWENPAEYGGIMWFTSKGKKYRLTRNFYKEKKLGELLCEDDGSLVDAEQGALGTILGNVSEAVYDNTVSVAQLKSVTGKDLVRELQNYMASYQGTGDSSIDMGRAMQMLKMSRKGYLTEAARRKKELEKEKEKISANMEYIRREIRELDEKRDRIMQQQDGMNIGTRERSTEDLLELRIDRVKRRREQTDAVLAVVLLGGIAGTGCLAAFSGQVIFSVLAGVATAAISVAALFFRIRLSRELNKRERQRERWHSRHEELTWNRNSLDSDYEEKHTALENLQAELTECEENTEVITPEETEIQALNMAMETIEALSGNITDQVGVRLKKRTSEILSEITGGRYQEVLMDEALHMSVNTGERIVSIERLSRGTLEQIYFALRMAAGELFCKEEPFPVILDDVFGMYDEERLANILYLYGELKNSRKLASVIVKARSGQNIRTIGEFLEIIKPLFGREREKKELAKVFQALRIEVNQEMEALKEMLLAATEALKPGGRLVVITYHSLEDRMVKNIMKTGNVEGKAETDFFGNLQTPFRLVNNKVIVPDEAEIERNPRSRSAKLRIAEKK